MKQLSLGVKKRSHRYKIAFWRIKMGRRARALRACAPPHLILAKENLRRCQLFWRRVGYVRPPNRVRHAAGKNASVKANINWMMAKCLPNHVFCCARPTLSGPDIGFGGRNWLCTFLVGRFSRCSFIFIYKFIHLIATRIPPNQGKRPRLFFSFVASSLIRTYGCLALLTKPTK